MFRLIRTLFDFVRSFVSHSPWIRGFASDHVFEAAYPYNAVFVGLRQTKLSEKLKSVSTPLSFIPVTRASFFASNGILPFKYSSTPVFILISIIFIYNTIYSYPVSVLSGILMLLVSKEISLSFSQ